MIKIMLLVLLTSILISCGTDNKPKIIHDKNNNGKNEIRIDSTSIEISDLPIQIDSTDYLIHPIGNFKIKDEKGKIIYKSSNYGTKNFSVSNYGNYRITGNLSNVKFQHVDSEKMNILTDNIIKIKSLTFLRKIFDNTKKQFLVYEVNDKDTNQDGNLDYEDINTLYISKINGTNFQKLTKQDVELIDWKVVESKNRLYFRTIEDTNKDGEFDKKDILHYNFIDLTNDDLEISEYEPI